MRPPRLAATEITRHLLAEEPAVRATVRALRRAVLRAAPMAAEAFKFHVLCYFHDDAWFRSIGGNICMIEIKRGGVQLSFIHGAQLPDPARLLAGRAKSKRSVRIPDARFAARPEVASLIRAASALRPWD